MTIPKRLVRTVPENSTVQSEAFWQVAKAYHPDWQHVTWRDPIDKSQFPITSQYWPDCESGAQLADLVRAEDLFRNGGVYLDSDFELFKPLDPLMGTKGGFAAWEDSNVICNAVLGFEPGHMGLGTYLNEAVKILDKGTWSSGVGLFTQVMKYRGDILLLPPETFYPVHYKHKDWGMGYYKECINYPWAFGLHHWAHSWKPVGNGTEVRTGRGQGLVP